MKILAIDPGSKRIGLAATDELHLSIRLLPVLQVQGLHQSMNALIGIIQSEPFHKVLVGLPMNMDGSEGRSATAARKLKDALDKELARQKISCEVLLWDERLTSFEAEQRMRQQGVAKAKAKAFLDSVAAEVLLEDYLHTTEGSQAHFETSEEDIP